MASNYYKEALEKGYQLGTIVNHFSTFGINDKGVIGYKFAYVDAHGNLYPQKRANLGDPCDENIYDNGIISMYNFCSREVGGKEKLYVNNEEPKIMRKMLPTLASNGDLMVNVGPDYFHFLRYKAFKNLINDSKNKTIENKVIKQTFRLVGMKCRLFGYVGEFIIKKDYKFKFFNNDKSSGMIVMTGPFDGDKNMIVKDALVCTGFELLEVIELNSDTKI